MRFHASIEQSGKTATGIRVPDDAVDGLGAGKRPPVRVTIGAHTHRSTAAPMGGVFMVGISAENRANAGVAGGEDVDVEIELDTQPREVEVPADFAEALGRHPAAKRIFDALSYSNKRWRVQSVEGAKTDETRQRRIAKSVGVLREGRPR